MRVNIWGNMSPIYDYKCKSCGHVQEKFYRVKYKQKEVLCKCGKYATPAFINAPKVGGDESDYARRRFPYFDEMLDVKFNSLSEKNKYLKEKGIRIKDPGEKPTSRPKTDRKKCEENIVFSSDPNQLNRKIDDLVRKKIQKQEQRSK